MLSFQSGSKLVQPRLGFGYETYSSNSSFIGVKSCEGIIVLSFDIGMNWFQIGINSFH